MKISVSEKFIFSFIIASAWIIFCSWFSLPWILDLAELITIVPAVMVVAFIALFPGFMYMFLLSSYLVDRRPPLESLEVYPPVSILIAAYNEEKHILQTVQSIQEQEYKGDIEVLIIDDGSTDRTINILEVA